MTGPSAKRARRSLVVCFLAASGCSGALPGSQPHSGGRTDDGTDAPSTCLNGVCGDSICELIGPCPLGERCSAEQGKCVPTHTCQYRPPVGEFAPSIEWQWTGSPVASSHNQVMMAPMVANMTDDNGDGHIDRNDIPDIVFHTFSGDAYQTNGILRIISGDGSGEHLTVTDTRTDPSSQIALGDIDSDGSPEIVTCDQGGHLIAFERDGSLKWRVDTNIGTCFAPAIADINGDGQPEVVSCYSVIDGGSGDVVWAGPTADCRTTTVADLDEDGRPEIFGHNAIFSFDHQLHGRAIWREPGREIGSVAVADLDGNGDAEVVIVDTGKHSVLAINHDGTPLWGPVDINPRPVGSSDKCNGCGGGPPTVADFDGDGKSEIGVAGGWSYVVLEHDGQLKWSSATQDFSSRATGSSVFDFDGDGKAEAVYNDEMVLRIYDGADGNNVLLSQCNTSGTLWEYPVIVDVDNDGHAEIVVANNNYRFEACHDGSRSSTGIKVLADRENRWVRTRRIWNQHTYHVTNIDEDGRVPKVEERNWDIPGLNNYRQNVELEDVLLAPDLVGTVPPTLERASCSHSIRATVEVTNQGDAHVLAGMPVTLYAQLNAEAPTAIVTVQTKHDLAPKQREIVAFEAPVPDTFIGQTIVLHAMIDDDGTGIGFQNECDETNNRVDLDTPNPCVRATID